MGSNTSKQSNDSAFLQQKNAIETTSNADPRSPTPEIIRTPLQCKPDSKHHITKNADLRKTFENAADDEKLIHNNPILSAVIKNHLLSYDPRSPTQDFERTPIVLTSKGDNEFEDNEKIHHENVFRSPSLENDTFNDIDNNCDSCAEADESPQIMPKNLCNGFMDLTLSESVPVCDEPLGSSTASNEAIENNLSPKDPVIKGTELLETNFDCDDNFDESQEIVPNGDFKTSFSKIPRFKVLKDDPRSPSTGIERTPIVVTNSSADDNVEQMSDDTLIKVLQNTNTELRHAGNRPSDSPEGLLIYEDNDVPLNDTPRKSKCDANIGSRTPLSCMKNKSSVAHARSKSANEKSCKSQPVLTSKIARRASHIPRLKSLTKPTKLTSGSTISLKNLSKINLQGDCENTPPHSHRDKWDKDSSIVL